MWFAIGNLYNQLQNAEQAVPAFQKAIKISPENFMAHGQLGVTLYKLQRLEEAIACYKKVIELQPENVLAYANLAIAYIDIGSREEAVDCCLNATRLKPDFSGGHLLLASSYSSLGEYEKALNSYDHALKLEPKNLTATAGKSDSLLKLGRKHDAYEMLRSKVGKIGIEPSIVISYAAACPDTACKEQAAAYLESALKSPGLSHKQQLQLHFSAGRLYDQMEQYDLAFQHYEKGNNLAHRSYDAEADNVLFDSIIKTFSNSSLHKFPKVESHILTPVFIIGMPRSGTSLVERILGSHSKIYPAGELGDIPRIGNSLSNSTKAESRFPVGVFEVGVDSLIKFSHEHIKFLAELSNNTSIVTDKLPHNFLYLGFIQCLFPNAKIIHCKRDPLDTCLSNYFQYFSGPLDYPYDLANIANHYNNYMRIMKHWENTIDLPIYNLKYEALVSDQEYMTKELLSFLDLSIEESCLEFNRSVYVTRTASFEQVREPMYTRSIERWRHYEKHIGELIDNIKYE